MATIPEDIAAILDRLPADQQRSVLEYARSLEQSASVTGAPISTILRFVGTLPDDVIADMTQAIEAECERIEPDDNLSF